MFNPCQVIRQAPQLRFESESKLIGTKISQMNGSCQRKLGAKKLSRLNNDQSANTTDQKQTKTNKNKCKEHPPTQMNAVFAFFVQYVQLKKAGVLLGCCPQSAPTFYYYFGTKADWRRALLILASLGKLLGKSRPDDFWGGLPTAKSPVIIWQMGCVRVVFPGVLREFGGKADSPVAVPFST